MHESIDKLLEIKHSYHYTNNPFEYKNDFNDNTTKCFRCVHKDSKLNETYISPNHGIFTERAVINFHFIFSKNLETNKYFNISAKNWVMIMFFCVCVNILRMSFFLVLSYIF